MRDNCEKKLVRIIKEQTWLTEVFRNVRNLQLPDCYIAGGMVRNTIWNYLHGYPTHLNQKDIDVIYFDERDINGEREKISEKFLRTKLPNLTWEVVNQARAHLFKPGHSLIRPKVNCSCESISYWSETPTCVGMRLKDDCNFVICAPYGLKDLFNLVVKPIPEPFRDIELYRKRIRDKRWNETWSKLKILDC